MTEITSFELPNALEDYRILFENSARYSIRIELEKRDREPTLFESRVGGDPYFPIDQEYPTNEKGIPLFLLAQINCEEIQKVRELRTVIADDPQLSLLPKQGMLSFFVDYSDDMMGLDLDGAGKTGHKVLYFPEITIDQSKLLTDFSFLDHVLLPKYWGIGLEYGDAYNMIFSLEEQMITPVAEFEWETFLEENDDLKESLAEIMEEGEEEELMEELFETTVVGHRIGGYPAFTQNDPRYGESIYDLLLFQLDSDKYITWGDSGVGNFFIHSADLEVLNFDNVLYNWDCV